MTLIYIQLSVAFELQEVENGRLFRILGKLGTISERPEFQLDPSWSETGDRYMLKLYRDYLFHQVDENGAPWIDMSHIVQSLNKVSTLFSTRVFRSIVPRAPWVFSPQGRICVGISFSKNICFTMQFLYAIVFSYSTA